MKAPKPTDETGSGDPEPLDQKDAQAAPQHFPGTFCGFNFAQWVMLILALMMIGMLRDCCDESRHDGSELGGYNNIFDKNGKVRDAKDFRWLGM